jgi:RHS repeat-associated protein
VLVNLTAVNPTATGSLLAYADGATRPATSDTNFAAGKTVSNEVAVPVSSDGKIRIYNSAGTTNVIVDVVGYFRTDPLFALNASFTVEFFAKAVAGSGATPVAQAGSTSGPDGWAITEGADNKLTFTRNGTSVTSTGTLSSSAWRHVAFTFSESSAPDVGTARFYLGGTLDKTQSVSFADSKPQTAVIWGLGAISLDEAAIHGRALDAGEIAAQQAAATGTASTTASYRYDPTGLRRSKTVAGTITDFGWDRSAGLPMLLTETTASATTSYVYGPDGRLIEQISPTGVASYVVADQLGSTRALTDGAGNVVATFTYDAFGKRIAATGAVSTPLGFAGEYSDAETGFSYLRARYYDPATAQFLSRDPLDALTRDAYGYAAGDPVNFVDPSGLAPWDGLASFFVGSGCDGDGLLGRVGGFLSDNAGSIAFGATALAFFVPGLNVVALGFGAWSAYGNAREGNYLLAVLDVVGVGATGFAIRNVGRAGLLTIGARRSLVGRSFMTPWFEIDAARAYRLAREWSLGSFAAGSLGKALGIRA